MKFGINADLYGDIYKTGYWLATLPVGFKNPELYWGVINKAINTLKYVKVARRKYLLKCVPYLYMSVTFKGEVTMYPKIPYFNTCFYPATLICR